MKAALEAEQDESEDADADDQDADDSAVLTLASRMPTLRAMTC